MTGLRAFARCRMHLTPHDCFLRQSTPLRLRFANLSAQPMESSSYASSTMDLVDDHENWAGNVGSGCSTSTHSLSSTIPFGSQHDFDPSLTASTRNPIQYDFQTWNELSDSVASSKYCGRIVAVEMDLVQAQTSRQVFDKIVLLVHHGEEELVDAATNDPKTSFIRQDFKLSNRGVGQALSLARRISAFCNHQTGLVPDLFILAPLRQALQTAMLALPHYSPFYAFRHIPWLCHAAAATTTPHPNQAQHQQQQQRLAPGGSSSPQNELLVQDAGNDNNNKADWFERTDAVLDMIRRRDEKVIVVCTESNWLQAFGCLTQYKRSQQLFRHGELRAVGINFV